ncbi:MAG: hypothetical protein EZS28_011679 [Streblomastix strix]|uniref:Uncharacterized protein n=1 Tax=Streblomastix strix TaxID=222440 RepID=A0A5J4WCZ9_9EUKA|nr:MAG: hypothetical protein EZS28_011679 [Streblomastix strix]
MADPEIASQSSRNSSSSNIYDQSFAWVHFNKLDKILFSYMYSFKMFKLNLSNAFILGFYILNTLQWFFVPLKRPDINALGFQHVIKTIGLYFDPSFYIPSRTSLIVFITIFITSFVILGVLGIIQSIFNENNIKTPSELLLFTQFIAIMITYVSPTPIFGLLSKPIICIVKKKGIESFTSAFCSENNLTNSILMAIASVFLIIIFAFLCIFKMFSYRHDLKHGNWITGRRGVFHMIFLSGILLDVIFTTALLEIIPIVAAIIHTIIFLILGLFCIISSPFHRRQGNMIITGACGVAIAGGIIGIILGPLEKLAVGRIDDNKINSYISRVIDIHNSLIENNKSNQSNATVIGANIILYICIITLPVIFALLGIIIADKVT